MVSRETIVLSAFYPDHKEKSRYFLTASFVFLMFLVKQACDRAFFADTQD